MAWTLFAHACPRSFYGITHPVTVCPLSRRTGPTSADRSEEGRAGAGLETTFPKRLSPDPVEACMGIMCYAAVVLFAGWSLGLALARHLWARWRESLRHARRAWIRGGVLGVAAAALLAIQGCAAIGLTLFAVGAGTAAGAGVSHTLDGIAYKTFTVSLEGLHAAALMTLSRMDISVTASPDTEAGRKILAQAGDREIEIELDRLTSQTTRMRVVAKRNWLIRDRATATEVILQADQTLTDNPHLAALGAEAKPPEKWVP